MNAIEMVLWGICGVVAQILVSFPALWLSLLPVVPVWKISDWPHGPGKQLRNLGLLLIGLVFLGSALAETWVTWKAFGWLEHALGLRHVRALHAGTVVVAAAFALLKCFFVGTAFGKTCAMADWLAQGDRDRVGAGVADTEALHTPDLMHGLCGEAGASLK